MWKICYFKTNNFRTLKTEILQRLGVSMSGLINMTIKQVIMQGGIPFDVKLTVYPAKLWSRPYDLSTREGKNEMIRWYYANQSQQSRKQMLNRLYVVCDARTPYENMVMKSNFDLMRERISAFMKYVKEHGLNEITITDCGKDYRLKSDIIRLD